MIGKNILEIRKNRGLTLTELAERASISKSYLSNIERDLNQNPSLHVMKKVATVLDVDIKTLLKYEGNEEKSVLIETEWIEFVNELKETGIDKDQLQDYKTVIEFIKWQNQSVENKS
ncbi:helix-turn-helix domain-containing protein [Bacillus sp. AK128]